MIFRSPLGSLGSRRVGATRSVDRLAMNPLRAAFPFARHRCLSVSVLLVCLACAGQAAAAQRRAMFADDTRQFARPEVTDPAVVRQRETAVDLALLRDPRASGGLAAPAPARSIVLNLFSDAELTAVLSRVEQVSPLGYAWVGTIAGIEGSLVVIGVSEGVVTISVEVGRTIYSVRPSTPGRYLVTQATSVAMAADAPPISIRATGAASGVNGDSGDTYDLLVLYTSAARAAAGGTKAIQALIVASIARLNSVYDASDVHTRCRLVGAVESSYAEAGAVGQDLAGIRTDAEANSLREQYGADVVSLVVSSDRAGYSGIAYLMTSNDTSFAPWAYNVCRLDAAWAPTLRMLPHLLGHTQGAHHEPGQGCPGLFPYSCGYADLVNGFATLMSSAVDCPHCQSLPQFSNPAIRYKSVPTGAATQDNARTLNESRVAVANFRQARDMAAAVVVSQQTPPTAAVVERPGAASDSGAVVSRPWSCWAMASVPASVFSNIVRAPACESVSTAAGTLRLESPIGARAMAPAAVPGAPVTLVASVAGRTVTLTWGPPAGASPTSYVLEAGSAPGLSDLVNTDTGSATPALVATDVAPGTYYVRVRARNAGGIGPVSNEVVVAVRGECPGVPGAPTGLTVTVAGSSVVLNWQAPSGACTPGYYVIEAGSASGLSNLALFSTGNAATTFAATGVASGRYFVRIRSGSQAGISAASNEVNFTAGAPPCTLAPSPPMDLSRTVSGTTVRLTWNASTWGNPTSYVVEAGSSQGLSDIVVWDTGSTTTSFTVEAAVGTYFVRVRARNNCGTSLPSIELILSVVIGVPGPPIVTANPASRTVAARTIVTFSAAATGNPTPVVAWQSRPNSTPSWTSIAGATSINYTRTASQEDDGRQFRAVFTNGYGVAYTSEASLTIECAMPVAPAITLHPASGLYATGRYVTLRSTATGCPVPAIQWQQSSDGGLTWTNVTGETTARWEFEMGTRDFQARAVFSNVAGTVISSVAALTVLRRPEILVQPQDVTVEAGTQVTFTAAASCLAPLSATWTSTGGVITNTADGPTLTTTQTFTATASDNGRRFSVQFCPTPCWDLCCASTRQATLTVTTPASKTQPRDADR
ncbi:MAG: M12 family metallo-peptidase [Acidobacteria bacterium]|nr:M12 family metallo-peptidase [Acidobacteriota bacterium]